MARRAQLGVALITALLVVATATAAAVAMAARQQLDIRRTGNLLHGTQAIAYTEGAESWAKAVLTRDARDSQIDALDEDWAVALPATLVEGGVISGRLIDLQGFFNLNSLVDGNGQADEEAVTRFKTLLRNLGVDNEGIADALIDWIDPDINVRFPDGAEDQAYLLLKPAYRTANRLMADVSELRLVQGFTPEIVAKLLPYVVALPAPTPINVNTAPAEVLRVLDANMSLGVAESLVSAREQDGAFASVADFQNHPALQQGVQINANAATVSSQWFRLVAEADIGQARARLSSLLLRAQGSVEVVQRDRRLLSPLTAPAPETGASP